VPVDARMNLRTGEEHVVDDFPQLGDAGMAQRLVTAELDTPERRVRIASRGICARTQ
jgi:hypothetical protein